MKAPEWDWFLWQARRLEARGALPLLLAVLLLAGALGCWLALRQVHAETVALQQTAALPAPASAVSATDANDNDSRLAEFERVLPARSRTPDILAALFALGERQGVALAQGDYRLEEATGGIIRCHIRFPVTGDTGKVEGFVRAALRKFPALALDGVSFQRDSAALSNGEVEIRFILFLKPDHSTASTKVASAI